MNDCNRVEALTKEKQQQIEISQGREGTEESQRKR